MNDLQWVSGLLTDYVRLLAKDHPTAAQIVQGYCNSMMQKPEDPEATLDGDTEDQ